MKCLVVTGFHATQKPVSGEKEEKKAPNDQWCRSFVYSINKNTRMYHIAICKAPIIKERINIFTMKTHTNISTI